MFIDDTFSVDRAVTCSRCDFDDVVGLDIVAYSTLEMAEWACPECGATNEYSNDTIWDRADEYHDRMKEEF
jgi:transcription elongation factor Elf1